MAGSSSPGGECSGATSLSANHPAASAPDQAGQIDVGETDGVWCGVEGCAGARCSLSCLRLRMQMATERLGNDDAQTQLGLGMPSRQ